MGVPLKAEMHFAVKDVGEGERYAGEGERCLISHEIVMIQ
jgi:hypothetical protein